MLGLLPNIAIAAFSVKKQRKRCHRTSCVKAWGGALSDSPISTVGLMRCTASSRVGQGGASCRSGKGWIQT